MADNLQKRPSKGILKNSSSFDKQETHSHPKKSKETTFDEMNIIATLHPADKDYGHMKIDEPKTPFNFSEEEIDTLDASSLAEKIKAAVDKPPKFLHEEEEDLDEDDEGDEDLTDEEKLKKKEFQLKRKHHYNEFYAVHLARKLLEEDEDEEEECAGQLSTSPRASGSRSSPSTSPKSNRKTLPSSANTQGSSKRP